MHMSHSCGRLVGLNGDDNPERHDRKCCIKRKMGNETKENNKIKALKRR